MRAPKLRQFWQVGLRHETRQIWLNVGFHSSTQPTNLDKDKNDRETGEI